MQEKYMYDWLDTSFKTNRIVRNFLFGRLTLWASTCFNQTAGNFFNSFGMGIGSKTNLFNVDFNSKTN
jgi:hypothetical protein